MFTPINITYERLLPVIHNLPDFKCPAPIQMNPSQRNPSMRCDYHMDHGNETNRCRSIKLLIERLIKAGHLKRYINEVDHEEESAPTSGRVTTGVIVPPAPRVAINYILGGSLNDQYQSKGQQKKLLRAAMVKARVYAIHMGDSREDNKPIDDPISFPPINPNKVIMPHYEALVFTLCINGFDVHRVLVDSGSATNLLQLPAFNQMKLSPLMLNSTRRIVSGFNGATTITLGDITLLIQAGPVIQQVLFSIVEDLGPYNCIVGKNWMHSMKVVPSTYHQMVSYLTSAGQIDLLSN